MIALASEALDAIRRHGAKAYPEECCGALLGSLDSQPARVDRAERLANSREGDRRRRYVVSPQEYLRAERLASESGLALVGFYHSHPDHPAVPSEYDREHALPVFHYVVLAVAAGAPGEASAWILSPDRGVFEREPIVSKQSGGTS